MTTNHQIEVSDWTGFSFAVVSLICSLTTLLLIYLMRVWNGYLLLITSMTAFQVLYDINYILGAVPTYAACATWNFLDILGGLSVTLWTNIISFIVMFVVMKIRSFNIFRNYKYFVIIAVVFPLIIAILVLTRLEAASDDDDLPFTSCTYKPGEMSLVLRGIYYWGRLASIIFNFMVFGYTSYRVRLMAHMRAASANTQQVSVNSRESAFQVSENQTLAVFSLVSRMKYYPLAQAILRSGAAWNEFDDYRYDSFASNMMAAVCSPSTGIAYFVIFLIMQPKAYETLKCLVTWNWDMMNEEPTLKSNFFSKEDLNNFNEDELETIIDEADRRTRMTSLDMLSRSSNAIHFQNPLRSDL